MKVLIIGASGMLAKPVIKHLDQNGFELRLFSRSVNPEMFGNKFEIIQGNVLNLNDLDKAMKGCDAVHVSLSNINESLAAKVIVNSAEQNGIKLISTISGCTVSEGNRWFAMIDNKFQAEQVIINCGIPFMIFRPTWFFESLDLMIRNGKAAILGKQPNPYRWVAADDYARLLAKAYKTPDAKNKIFYIYGPEPFLMKDLLEKYIKTFHPEIKKVSTVPLGMIKMIARITGNNELKEAASLFAYFEKVKEPEISENTNKLIGAPVINFEKWLNLKKQML